MACLRVPQLSSQAGENIIGRIPDSQVVLHVPGVSRRHASITIPPGGEGGTRITDLGSKNGTIVHGQRITSAVKVRDGDQLEIGPVTLTYREVLPVRLGETNALQGAPGEERKVLTVRRPEGACGSCGVALVRKPAQARIAQNRGSA